MEADLRLDFYLVFTMMASFHFLICLGLIPTTHVGENTVRFTEVSKCIDTHKYASHRFLSSQQTFTY